MMTNIAILYSGLDAEAGAVSFAGAVAKSLNAGASCHYAASTLALLDAEQKNQYRSLMELNGFDVAQGFLNEQYRAQLAEKAKEASASFHALAAAKDVSWGPEVDLSVDPDLALTNVGFVHDMVVASFSLSPGVLDLLTKRVLFTAGGSLALIEKPLRSATLEESTMVVAWKPAAASKHALRYSLPLLKKAKKVYIASIEEEGYPGMSPTAQDMADYLMNVHNCAAEAFALRAADTVQAPLADFYEQVGADLLVMGAYSQSRLQELFFGSFTKYFLQHRNCNLMLAH
ncbi:MAG: universal stress protein [Gammaproteobacteria bacterium]|nr:universal stress protein [Gammaproteobacteria bacterium]MBI5616056.1 universal stress protein [Gammaproteobacteria bacterium]